MIYGSTAELFCDEYAAHRVLSTLDPPIDPELVGLGQKAIIRRHCVGAKDARNASGGLHTLTFVDGSAAVLRGKRWEILR